jgi:glutamine synthetase
MFGYSVTRPVMEKEYFKDIYDSCHKFNIPIEGFHTETGPGVYEAALEYTNALEMADRAHLFKTAVKQIGLKYGIIPSFMAKPYPDLPGCSGHIHFSIAGFDGENKFKANDNGSMSKELKCFIAGVLKGLPSIMPILAPTINSYKRLVENFWAPVNVSYGFENRTTAIRIVNYIHFIHYETRLHLQLAIPKELVLRFEYQVQTSTLIWPSLQLPHVGFTVSRMSSS